MSVIIVLITILSITLVIYYVITGGFKPRNYPPGPFFQPIIGSIKTIQNYAKLYGSQHLAFEALSKQFTSNILGLKFGKEYVVVVLKHRLVHQVLTREEFEGRPDNFFMRLRTMGARKGITGIDGDLWRVQRRFAEKHLRQLGYGKNVMRNMVEDEIGQILKTIKENPVNVDVTKLLTPGVLNILWTFVTGTRFAQDDPKLMLLLDLLETRAHSFNMAGNLLSHMPWLRHIVPEYVGYNLIKKLNCELKNILTETIQSHKESLNDSNKNHDFIYTFLNQQMICDEDQETFDDEQLLMICLDLFIAGSQTTSNTLSFMILMMILHEGVQDKVYAAVSEAFKKTDEIKYKDRDKVPYVEAVIMEVMRYIYVVPIIGPRRALKETVLGGYRIPKDSTILLSIYSVHFDKDYWKDPEVFRPERFIDNQGRLIYHDRLIAFGLGRRRCVGDLLARNCIFTFFIEIIRKYRIEAMTKPTGIPIAGLTMTPEYYKAKFILRE